MNRALLPLLLALALGCRGTFDLDKYIADAESGTAGSASTTDGTATTDASTTLDDSSTTDATSAGTDTTDTDTTDTDTDTSTDTDAGCMPGLIDVGGACIGLKQTLSAMNVPSDIEVGDFTQDGLLDLLIPGSPVRYAPGSDTGTFSDQLPIIGSNGTALASVDWDDDGNLDVLVISDISIELFFSGGGGAFNSGSTYMFGGYDGAFGQINADDFEDIVLTGPVSVRGYQRDGSNLSESVIGAFPAQSVLLANLDLNAGQDVAVVMLDQVGVLLGDGNGGFGAVIQFAFPLVADVAVADLFADEGVELLAVGGEVGQLMLLEVQGAVLEQVGAFAVGGSPRAVAAGDISGDGVTDIAVGNASTHDVSVLVGEGGSLTNEYRLAVDNPMDNPESIEVADLDNDGYAEIIVGMISSNRVLVYGHIE